MTETNKNNERDTIPGWAVLPLLFLGTLVGGCLGYSWNKADRKELQQELDWYKADRDRWQHEFEDCLAKNRGWKLFYERDAQRCGK